MRKLALVTGLALIAGCAVGPQYEAPEVALPGTWPEHAVLEPVDADELAGWWQRFKDPALDRLVERALEENLELRLQAARIEEARGRLGLARAEQWPTVGVQAEASRERQPAAVFGIEDFDIPPRNLFFLSGVLNYEIDLWGRLARQRDAAAAQLDGNLHALEAVRLALVTDVAVGYFQLRSAQRQLEITERTLAARMESARIERLRFEAGQIDELLLRQAETELAGVRAELPLRIAAVRRAESVLGILLGMSPAELLATLEFEAGEIEAVAMPDNVPAELPAMLLERRPDLRAAEAELVAATAGVGVAQAARLPQLNLVGLVGLAATSPGDLFDSDAEAWSIGATVAGPLLDFGRGRARVESAEAVREQAELRYRASIAVAFAEVRDALVLHDTSSARLEAVETQLEALQRTESLAEVRYREGYIGILELLDVQRALLGAEMAMAQARAERLAATATLFKALGGGW